MIAAISSITSSFSYSVEYNEHKTEQGKAKLLENNTGSEQENKEQYETAFNEVIDLNSNVNKNIGMHIAISLNPSEKDTTDEKFLEISHEYLEKMGYGNCPSLIYRHFDNNNPHLHIITTSVDREGQKIKEFKNFTRSMRISRALEIKHGIKFTIYDENREKMEN
jgi:hypothetical protein